MIRALFSVTLAAGLIAKGITQEAHSDSRVVTGGGDWRLGQKKLERGQIIPGNATLSTEGTASGSLLLDCGKELGLLSYRCNRGPCTVEACRSKTAAAGVDVVPVSVAPQLASFFELPQVVKSLLTHEPKQPEMAGVRAPGNPNDAVLLQSAGNVHFGPALTRVLEGQYCLRLIPMPAAQSQAPVAVQINWDRSADPEGSAPAGGLTPGLYSLEKGAPSNGGCQVAGDAVPAWVVIAPEAAFPDLSAQWKNIAPKIAELSKDDVGGDVLMTLRHAALAFLADSIKKQ